MACLYVMVGSTEGLNLLKFGITRDESSARRRKAHGANNPMRRPIAMDTWAEIHSCDVEVKRVESQAKRLVLAKHCYGASVPVNGSGEWVVSFCGTRRDLYSSALCCLSAAAAMSLSGERSAVWCRHISSAARHHPESELWDGPWVSEAETLAALDGPVSRINLGGRAV